VNILREIRVWKKNFEKNDMNGADIETLWGEDKEYL